MDTKTAQKLPAVIIPSAIDKHEIALIHQIGDQQSENDHKQLRADGHRVTFLQKDGLFEQAAPKLLSKIVELMRKTDDQHWKLIQHAIAEPDNVNYRVIEYHHYQTGGGLLNKHHFDGGSILTAVFMLSDPSKDFEGGQLMTWECDDTFKKYEVRQGDMLLFPSHKYHSVSTVTKGERYVLVIELWEGAKGTDGHRTGGFGHLIPAYGFNANSF
eukprot:CAMPEP_0197020420 /NCGR_PEP_ID=MMETSP1384-20130603/1181_1 /TAXON_ID=29189 /ORGANISM="Ammonia sp." /LENGTH=213 /DNA_ID=CAMNT_0042448033 /DNA_START=98 /DNA_END=739 /DNA_ORIENTATION=-